jgi:N-acetylglucosamine-6-phosphate deacetylase
MDPTASNGLYPFRPPQQVLRQGLSITLEGTSTLAGSAIDMATSVRNLSAFASIPMWKAIACCTTNAAKALGGRWAERKGKLEKGWDADMVVLDGKGEVKATWVKGREVWKRKD